VPVMRSLLRRRTLMKVVICRRWDRVGFVRGSGIGIVQHAALGWYLNYRYHRIKSMRQLGESDG
jgi:hypothetical protein